MCSRYICRSMFWKESTSLVLLNFSLLSFMFMNMLLLLSTSENNDKIFCLSQSYGKEDDFMRIGDHSSDERIKKNSFRLFAYLCLRQSYSNEDDFILSFWSSRERTMMSANLSTDLFLSSFSFCRLNLISMNFKWSALCVLSSVIWTDSIWTSLIADLNQIRRDFLSSYCK